MSTDFRSKWDLAREKSARRDADLAAKLAATVEPLQHDENGTPFLAFSHITAPRVVIPAARLYLLGIEHAYPENPNQRNHPSHGARFEVADGTGARVIGASIHARFRLARAITHAAPPSTWSGYGMSYSGAVMVAGSNAAAGPAAAATVRTVAALLCERYIFADDLRAGYVAQAQQEADFRKRKADEAAEAARLLANDAAALQDDANMTRHGREVLAVLDANGRLIRLTTNPTTAEQTRAGVYVHRYDEAEGKRPVVVQMFPAVGK